MTRDERIVLFLVRHGYDPADVEPLAQDASSRRYLRLRGPRKAVLMDAPPPEDVRPFLRIADYLSAIGLSAPVIIAADPAQGLIMEEDLGDDLLSALLDAAGATAVRTGLDAPMNVPQEAAFDSPLDAAIDALVAMQRPAPPADLPPDLPLWDAAMMAQTAMGTLFDWWWLARHGSAAPDAARREIAAALQETLRPVAAGPRGFVHRDFFAGNLLWLPERTGARRIGILDFQGAAIGHPAYDLVSLLQDARRDIPPALRRRALRRYLAARPELDADSFQAAFTACAAQRHLRVACQWIRLAQRDGRPQYLVHGPRTWRLLADALRQPAAAPLAAALNRWIPAEHRANPPGLAA